MMPCPGKLFSLGLIAIICPNFDKLKMMADVK